MFQDVEGQVEICKNSQNQTKECNPLLSDDMIQQRKKVPGIMFPHTSLQNTTTLFELSDIKVRPKPSSILGLPILGQ